ncbi:hypothetical protein ACFFX0_04680 [Citricoccus parietis]|uniref:Uncharacterized protein n=1 Tax=Citricoccus parietis TaxID=592307 RepID=A0ABV5FV14_9MICC
MARGTPGRSDPAPSGGAPGPPPGSGGCQDSRYSERGGGSPSPFCQVMAPSIPAFFMHVSGCLPAVPARHPDFCMTDKKAP